MLRGGLIFATASLVVLSGCAKQDPGAQAKGAVPEQSLLAFAEANPTCSIWTNWRQMCSRTGPRGEPWCARDPDRVVEPSEPFCVVANTPDAGNPVLTSSQRVSSGRFCVREEPSYAKRRPTDPEGPLRVCTRYDPERPFNGRRVAARLHPWCEAWGEVKTGKPVCTARGSGRVPRCGDLAAAGAVVPNGLYCSAWRRPKWCGSAGSGAEHEERGKHQIWLGVSGISEMEVLGVWCGRGD